MYFSAGLGATAGANAGAAAEFVGSLGVAPGALAAMPGVEGVKLTRLVRGATSLTASVKINTRADRL